MSSSDSALAHFYDLSASSGLPNRRAGVDLLLRLESRPYDNAVRDGTGIEAIAMAMPSGHSHGISPARGQMADVSSLDMTATARKATCEYQVPPLQQHTNVQHPYPHRCQPQSDASNSGAGATTAPKPIRRRMRMITSCLECRRRKLKCNKSQPCTNCLKFSRDCFYLGPKLDEASQLRLSEIKEKVGSLERQLERDVAKSGNAADRGLHQKQILPDEMDREFEEEVDLEITPMVGFDLIFENDADGIDDVMDLGVRVGKMRLNEKIGVFEPPRMSKEIHAGLSGNLPQLGCLSPGLACPGFSLGTPNRPGFSPDPAGSDQYFPDYFHPGGSYMPPTSGVFFGQVVQSPSLLAYLPTKPAGDRLLQYYFDVVHPIARCVHRPSFQVRYDSFWEDATVGCEPRSSVQAVVFAAWFSAAVAMDENVINQEFGFTKTNLVENMKIATEVALSRANFLRTTKFETMQAFVMYMVPLCREEVSRAHSVLVGAAIRMAECMGLHRDGRNYSLNCLETHVRRIVWHQLCFLDLRTCEAQGPKPAIRREDYDTLLPDNCEEDQFLPNASSTPNINQRSDGWTSTLFSLIRFEVSEMMRTVWADRCKLESRTIILTQALTKIEAFRKRMLASYDHLLDERIPIQRYAKVVMHLLLYRLTVMVLRPHYTKDASDMSTRLRSVLMMSSIMLIELAMQLDMNPAFRLWRWYAGAYQQYQAALILATEIYYYPAHKEAERVWICLNYVFELDGNKTSEEKGRHILMDVMEKMGAYMSMRKARAPILTANASPGKQAVKMEEVISRPRGGAVDSSTPPLPQKIDPQMRGVHLPMKEESGMVSPVGTGPRSRSSFDPSSSGTPTSVSPLPQRGTLGSHVVTVNCSSDENVWSLPPPPSHPDGPEDSSSDSGSLSGGVGGQRQCNLGGTGTSTLGAAPSHIMNGAWSDYQEDAINALFPFDPQTGSFAGSPDPLTSVFSHSNGCIQQSQSQRM